MGVSSSHNSRPGDDGGTKAHQSATPGADRGHASLESVLITEELSRRPAREPDYESENRALVSLAQELASSPQHALQMLVKAAMELCKAYSAGISFLDKENETIFRWSAIVGPFALNLDGTGARDLSPCGVALDRNSVLLLSYPERHFHVPIDPPIPEALLIPFHVAGKPIGTLWVTAHDESRKFDREDARILQNLGRFASSGYMVLSAHKSLKLEMAEHKKAEEELRTSEARLRALLSASSQVLYRMSPDWSEMRQLGGGGVMDDTATPSTTWLRKYIPQDEQPKVLATIHEALKTKKKLFELEHRVRMVDGGIGWVHSRAVPLLDEKGEITEWFGSANDVTAHKRAEHELHESKNRLRTVVENLAEGLIVVDPKRETLDWNLAALHMHGFNAHGEQPVLLSDIADLFEVRRLDGIPVSVEQWPVNRLLRGEEMNDCEFVVRRKTDGRERIFSYGGVLLRNAAGKAVLGLLTIRDVTDYKKAQHALLRAEKLASVGRMAATIAHEVNNPLAAAMNAIYLASSSPDLPDFARSNMALADQELRRIAHITEQTLGFYKEAGPPTSVHLPEILDGILRLYSPQLRNKSIVVERKYRGMGRVYGSEGELRQVFSNVIANSIHALPSTGKLHLRTASSKGDCPMVQLTIADTGVGISREHQTQIFEPFFTTKPSFGVGLGLWITKELILKHRGKVRVRSRVGKGTVFSIWLPTERRHQGSR